VRQSCLNHVAILVRDIERVLSDSNLDAAIVGNIERFPSEGTRELYIGDKSMGGRLLLIEPIAEGPYQRALKKRGPGLHHLAIDVSQLEDFVHSLGNSGWFLHPSSVESLKRSRTAWLCRSGCPLIEVQESQLRDFSNYFVEKVIHPFSEEKLVTALNCRRLSSGIRFKLETKRGEQIRLDGI
jgi:hypothetical protein